MAYVAKDMERLESVYYTLHGTNDGRYREFCLLNVHLVHKDRLEAGDIVKRLESKTTTINTTARLKLW